MATKKTKKNTARSRENYFRVPVTMPREMNDWLERLGSEAKEQGGFKLSKCEIVRATLRALREAQSHLDVSEVRSEDTLVDRITAAFTQAKKRKR